MTKDLQEKCDIIARSRNISFFISWLTWFSSCRIFISVLDAFQNVMRCGFKLLFHADDDAKGFRSSILSAKKREQNQNAHPAQHQDAVLNSSMLRKDYENGIIVFYATSSSRMYMFQIFACKKRPIPHVDKIHNPKLGCCFKLCCPLRFAFWILSSCLLRNKVSQKHAAPPLVFIARRWRGESCVRHKILCRPQDGRQDGDKIAPRRR